MLSTKNLHRNPVADSGLLGKGNPLVSRHCDDVFRLGLNVLNALLHLPSKSFWRKDLGLEVDWLPVLRQRPRH